MRTWAHWTAKTVMLTATFAAAGAGLPGAALAAPAGGGGSTTGLGSVLGGNQASAPISAPADVCGSAVAVLGLGLAGCQGGASVTGPPAGSSGGSVSAATSGNGSVSGGNQISAPVSVPVSVCGNAVGNAVAGCQGGASVSGAHGGTGPATSGNGSVGGGNQTAAPVSVPADVCGNAAAVLGDSLAGCEGTASVRQGPQSSRGRAGGRGAGAVGTQLGAGGAGRAGGIASARPRQPASRRGAERPAVTVGVLQPHRSRGARRGQRTGGRGHRGRAADTGERAGRRLGVRHGRRVVLLPGHRSPDGRGRCAQDGGTAHPGSPHPGPQSLRTPRAGA